jgi:hypothetical protein
MGLLTCVYKNNTYEINLSCSFHGIYSIMMINFITLMTDETSFQYIKQMLLKTKNFNYQLQ